MKKAKEEYIVFATSVAIINGKAVGSAFCNYYPTLEKASEFIKASPQRDVYYHILMRHEDAVLPVTKWNIGAFEEPTNKEEK